ncbi:MAG: transcription initiation factor IIB family protein [Desulfurococcus sp.]|nr:transcription initiation factor IIB family protein [Desulfurococcus sp.]
MKSPLRCRYCGSTNIIYDPEHDAYVCQVCGSVLDERPAYQGYEGFSKSENTPRYSGAFTHMVHDHGVGGTEIAGSFMKHIREGRGWVRANSEIRVEKKDRRLKRALQELNEYLRILDPPIAIRETAARLIHETVRGRNYKEKTIRRIVLAAIYLSYKIHKQPRSPKLFSQELGISESDLWDGVRMIREATSSVKLGSEHYDPRHYVGFITRRLNMPPVVEALANLIVTSVEEHGFISGKNPASLAAASVYLAGILSNNKRNQTEVAEKVGLTDVAIRNTYDSIIRNIDIEILL